jgi:hypothetical protein
MSTPHIDSEGASAQVVRAEAVELPGLKRGPVQAPWLSACVHAQV